MTYIYVLFLVSFAQSPPAPVQELAYFAQSSQCEQINTELRNHADDDTTFVCVPVKFDH